MDLEVGLVSRYLPPIAHIEEGSEQVRLETAKGIGCEKHRRRTGARDHEKCRGEKPPRAPEVKGPYRDIPGLTELSGKQESDEEAGYRKEDIHAEKAALKPAWKLGVIEQHAGNGNCPKPIETGQAVAGCSIRQRACVTVRSHRWLGRSVGWKTPLWRRRADPRS